MARLGAGAKVGKASRAAVGTVTGTVGGVVSGASGAVAPVAGATARELRKLENQLTKARKLETKRFSQLAAAERSKGEKGVERRLHQAGDAAADVARIVAKMGVLVKHGSGAAVSAAGSAARDAGTAAATAARTVSPIKSSAGTVPAGSTSAPSTSGVSS